VETSTGWKEAEEIKERNQNQMFSSDFSQSQLPTKGKNQKLDIYKII
jgi:hypothetical protein